MAPKNKSFSQDGEYFALITDEGRFKIWELSSNTMKEPLTPKHATCSVLAWGPCKHHNSSPKKIKNNKDHCIALGMMSGDMQLYSIVTGEIVDLDEGHSSTVNDICWYPEGNSLVTCSNDKHIIIWNIPEGKVKQKWIADDDDAVTSICVIDDENMLSCSSVIKWWNVKEQTIIKKFCDHSTEIFQIASLSVSKNSSNTVYFLTAAISDKVINAWQLTDENGKTTAASFALAEEPECMEVSKNPVNSQSMLLSVITMDGKLHIFEHVLNGKKKEIVQPVTTVQINSEISKMPEELNPIPIISAKVSENVSSFIVAYGDISRPQFEKMDISRNSKETLLIRNTNLAPVIQNDTYRITKPDKNKISSNSPKKRKNNHLKEPVEDIPQNRFNEDCETSNKHVLPLPLQNSTFGKMCNVREGDSTSLNLILQCKDEAEIKNVVKTLPLETLPLLLKELNCKLKTQRQRIPLLRCIKEILSAHLPFIISLSDKECLSSIKQLVEEKEIDKTLFKLRKLKGSLGILSQVATYSETSISNPVDSLMSDHRESVSETESSEDDHSHRSSESEVDKVLSDESDCEL